MGFWSSVRRWVVCGTEPSLDKEVILIHNDSSNAVWGHDSYLNTADSQQIAHTER
jgi:hypothetical protein